MHYPKEIFIRSALTIAAFAASSLLAAPNALADEFDWLYFPMYANDTAHAVHLSSLKFRPDGLLSAATRFPRTGGEPWTEQESKAGWYNYDQRLIDCETGYFLETGSALLGQDGATLATRAQDHAQQVNRLEEQLREGAARRWPNNSDIFLACAAASSPTFRKQRAAKAAKAPPLFSATSLIEVLSADSEALSATARMRYDFSRIQKRRAASASELFDDMRAQYGAWRKSINAGFVPGASLGGRSDQAVLAEANRQIKESRAAQVTIKSIQGALLEHVQPEAYDGALETARTDCEFGVSVPVARQPKGTLGAQAVLPDILRRYGDAGHADAEGPFGGFFLDSGAAALCQLVDQVRHAGADPVAEPGDASGFPFGLKPGALAQQATPAAMLLAIRSARRAHVH
jgi:hypothetical protein